MRLFCSWLFWLLVGLSPANAQVPQVPIDVQQALSHSGHALLIGVSDYTSGWPQLPNVKNDLDSLKKGLEPHFATVEIVPSPTVDELRTKMREFLSGKWNKSHERLFIYYSGHGFTDFNQSSQQNDGYITGSDTPLYNQADGRAVENAVPFTEIHAWNMQTKARHVLMVFDSCFSGSLFQTKGTMTEPNKYEFEGIRRMLGQPIRYFITAGRLSEEVSADSTFAKLLLLGLRGDADFSKQGVISADQLGVYLSREVPRASTRSQTPQFNNIGNVELSEGQFFFLTGKAATGGERRVVTYANGDRYDGELRNDQRNGHGVLTHAGGGWWPTHAKGDQYDGEFLDGKENGHGVLTYANGEQYNGEWRDGKENGHGVLTYPDGRRYDGEWRDGKKNGHGVSTMANGDRYDAEFRDGKKNGRGVYTRANGDLWEVEWREDLPHLIGQLK